MIPPKKANAAAASKQKWVCRQCQREFRNVKALAAHSKVHCKNIRKIRFTHTKRKSETRQDFLHFYLSPINKGLRRRRHRRQQQQQQRGGGSVEMVDLSRSLSGLGWQVRGKRSNNCRRKKAHDVHADDYDADVDVDADDSMVMERLRRYGFTCTAHKISRTRRRYICNPCNMHLPTFYAVLVHVTEGGCSATISSIEENRKAGAEVVQRVEEDEIGTKTSIETCGNGGPKDSEVSTLDPDKRLPFDLNGMPPKED